MDELARRLGLSPPAALVEELRQSLEARVEGLLAQRRARLHPLAPTLRPGFPRGLEETLVAALAVSSPEQAQVLRFYYLDWMPQALVESLCVEGAPGAALLHAPLLSPALEEAMRRLEALCGAALALEPGETLAQRYARSCFGGCMPMLYTLEQDRLAWERALSQGVAPELVAQRRLVGPLVHELAHFGRQRDFLQPTYLDECLAAWLGACCYAPQCFSSVEGREGIFGAPWLAQVGQALAWAFGPEPVARAQSGALPWEEVLPAGLRHRMERWGWRRWLQGRPPHFLSEHAAPEAWLRLIWWAAAGQDSPEDPDTLSAAQVREAAVELAPCAQREILLWGLRSMGLRPGLEGSVWRVAREQGVVEARLDWAAMQMEALWAPPGGPAQRYGLPPGLARRWCQAGCAALVLRWPGERALEPLAQALLEVDRAGLGHLAGVEVELG